MATIGQIQNQLQNRAKRYLIEQEIGRELMQRIKAAGGQLKINNGRNFFEFLDVAPELQSELDKKLPNVQKGLLRWQLD